MSFKEEYNRKLMTAEEAVKLVSSGDKVYAGTVSSISLGLLQALWNRRCELKNVEIQTNYTFEKSPVFENYEDNPFKYKTFFIGPNERKVYRKGLPIEYTSIHLSQIETWINNIADPDVCFLEVSMPDENGYMSYGPSGTADEEGLKNRAEKVILEVNKYVPYIYGESNLVHVSEATAIVENHRHLFSFPSPDADDVSKNISKAILEEVHDGATLQLGLGNISTAIGFDLRERNDLGIHTELFNQPMMDLIKNGNVTNKYKGFMDGLNVFAFALGNTEFYEFLNYNKDLYVAPFTYVNNPMNIAKNKNMISINNTMSIDLLGQCASDCIGWNQQSATGGQVDFVRGAQWSEGGKSFICTASSLEKNGKRVSKIVPVFPDGTAVTTARSDVQYLVTEYGCINVKEMSVPDRARAIISIAHPDFRDELYEQAKQYGIF